MAVNDSRTTEKIKNAALFFMTKHADFLRANDTRKKITVEDGEMIQAAAYAASFFLDDNKYAETCNGVLEMCRSYGRGVREFDWNYGWDAGAMCQKLVDEIKTLEKNAKPGF